MLQALLLFLTISSAASGRAASSPTSFLSPPAPPSSASFPLALSVLANMLKSQLKNSKDLFETCPQLWSKTSSQQKDKQSIFGSADEILQLCPTTNTSNNPPFSNSICQGAMGITGYVCKAIKSADYPASQPLIPSMDDLDKISQVDGLCEALGDVHFQESLCKIVETRLRAQQNFAVLQKPLDDICTKIPHEGFPKLCLDSCSGSINQRACKIILQGLRTIIYLETLKENEVSNSDGDSERLDTNKPSEKTDVKVNISQSQVGPLLRALLPANNSKQPGPMQSSAIENSYTTEKPPTMQNLVTNQSAASSKDSSSTSSKTAVETVTPALSQPKAINVQPAVSPSSTSTSKPEPVVNIAAKKDSNVSNSITTKTPAGQATVILPKTTTIEDTAAEDEPPEPEPEDDLIMDDETPKAEADPNLDEEDNAEKDMDKPVEVQNTVQDKPSKPDQSYDPQSEIDEDPTNTHFLFYFMFFVVISVTCYVVYQRRNRIIAFVIEGRSGQSSSRRRGSSRERPSSGSYRKLNNLEDAISSQSIKNSNVIY